MIWHFLFTSWCVCLFYAVPLFIFYFCDVSGGTGDSTNGEQWQQKHQQKCWKTYCWWQWPMEASITKHCRIWNLNSLNQSLTPINKSSFNYVPSNIIHVIAPFLICSSPLYIGFVLNVVCIQTLVTQLLIHYKIMLFCLFKKFH